MTPAQSQAGPTTELSMSAPHRSGQSPLSWHCGGSAGFQPGTGGTRRRSDFRQLRVSCQTRTKNANRCQQTSYDFGTKFSQRVRLKSGRESFKMRLARNLSVARARCSRVRGPAWARACRRVPAGTGARACACVRAPPRACVRGQACAGAGVTRVRAWE
jgi:hypothetical protein